MRLGKFLFIIFAVVVMFSACNSDASKANPEQGMFLKKPPAASYFISSPLEGIVLNNGKPVSNVRIVRRLRWNGNDDGLTQEFITDETGFFSMPAHEEILSIGALEQFVGKTNIDVENGAAMENIWFSAKTHPDLNSEYDTPPRDLICDLSNADLGVSINSGTCLTKCRWVNMPEAGDPNAL